MSNYILIHGELMSCDELNHHGVKGMKWGVRRAQKRAKKADRKISRIETNRKQNKLEYENMNATARDRYSSPKKAKKLARAEALNKADYDTSEIINKYAIARQKVKKDKNFKNSTEYMKAKSDYGKYTSQVYIYGYDGHRRIEQLKNLGASEKQAKRKAFTETALSAIGGVAVASLAVYGLRKAANR